MCANRQSKGDARVSPLETEVVSVVRYFSLLRQFKSDSTLSIFVQLLESTASSLYFERLKLLS